MDVAIVPRFRRSWFAVAAALAVAGFALTGCTIGNDAPDPNTPVAGTCWVVTYAQYQQLQGGDLASCNGDPHQAITYSVVTLDENFANGGVDSNGNPTAAVQEAAASACKQQQDGAFPGLPNTGLLLPNLYLPSAADWKAGNRSIQCTIAEIKYGSEVSAPELADLPSSVAAIQEQLQTTPKKFDLCENDPQLNGPDGAHATYADCTGTPDWSMVAAMTMDGAEGAPYPGAATLTAEGKKQCAAIDAPKGHDVYAETPTANTWAEGNRELDCWVNNN
jgi:hypothetical protein